MCYKSCQALPLKPPCHQPSALPVGFRPRQRGRRKRSIQAVRTKGATYIAIARMGYKSELTRISWAREIPMADLPCRHSVIPHLLGTVFHDSSTAVTFAACGVSNSQPAVKGEKGSNTKHFVLKAVLPPPNGLVTWAKVSPTTLQPAPTGIGTGSVRGDSHADLARQLRVCRHTGGGNSTGRRGGAESNNC